jgi:glycosyltransferase involved in cell wall biosynthesis
MGTVSAIVSAYHAKLFLESRLANLSGQMPKPEIVVIAQKYSAEADIVKRWDVTWILTEDIPTLYFAWNLGIRAANGDYITNANCDDYAYPGAYLEMSTILDNNAGIALVYGDNDVREGHTTRLHKRLEGGFDVLQKYCFVGPFPMWRRSLHDAHGMFDDDYRVCGDYEFWLRIAKAGEKFYHINHSIGLYFKRSDSLEHKYKLDALLEAKQIRRLYGGH